MEVSLGVGASFLCEGVVQGGGGRGMEVDVKSKKKQKKVFT